MHCVLGQSREEGCILGGKRRMEEARTAPFQRGAAVHLEGFAVARGCGEGEVGESEC
jgi:hypothetical protein